MRLVRYTYPSARNFSPVLGSAFRSPWSGLESELDRIFEHTLGSFSVPSADRFPVDLFEDKENTYLRAELPGVNREDIAVELADDVLKITATRKPSDNGGDAAAFTYSRAVTVPGDAVQADKIAAAYENGVLTVTLPKREEAKPRKRSVPVK